MDRAVSSGHGAPVGQAGRAPRPWWAVLGVGRMAGGEALWQCCAVASASSSCPSPVRLQCSCLGRRGGPRAGSPWVGSTACPYAVAHGPGPRGPRQPLRAVGQLPAAWPHPHSSIPTAPACKGAEHPGPRCALGSGQHTSLCPDHRLQRPPRDTRNQFPPADPASVGAAPVHGALPASVPPNPVPSPPQRSCGPGSATQALRWRALARMPGRAHPWPCSTGRPSLLVSAGAW